MADQDNRPEGTDTIVDDGTTALVENEPALGGPPDLPPAPAAATADEHAAIQAAPAEPTAPAAAADTRTTFEQLKQAAVDQTAELRAQAADRARDYVGQGKDRATEALENLAKMVSDAARQVEEKVGPDYAAYARRAADAVTGLSDSLKAKDVDALFEDAKGYIKQSPAVAIGAAAALGFVVARLAKAGLPGETPETGSADGKPGTAA